MFWGLIMEPNKRYTQIVEKPFHLSMASLDAATASGGLVQVMICYDDRNYLLCTLQKDKIWQVPLDLNFQDGTKISFTCNGDGHVHLTGFIVPEDEELCETTLDDEDGIEEGEIVPIRVDGKKRKAENAKDTNNLKRPKKAQEESDDDSDDELFESSDMTFSGDEDDDDDESDSDVEEDDDDEDDDEEDEDEDEDDDEEEDEEVTQPKHSKKEKQKQAKQNKEQLSNQSQNKDKKDKKEKNKMMNGKQEKPEKEQNKQKKNKNDSKSDKSDDSKVEQQQPKKRTVEGGVQVEDIKVGQGAPAKPGKFVTVYYVGRLKNGKKFDATQNGEGFKFKLGKGEVIKGWDVGLLGMKVGGKRRINIPPSMAYGAKGSPPCIPPNSWLNFEIELKSIH